MIKYSEEYKYTVKDKLIKRYMTADLTNPDSNLNDDGKSN